MLCIIAPEYESRDDETRHRSTDGDASEESEDGEPTDDDPSDGELLTAGPV
ncbi:hypothetical protein [Halosimplex pelagicum]|uniref:Uncharacterized protein n=1 Tax=Halosimplex pelagicum TaxID=869886 RepID=A0A7D5TV11_9EURY|nr:hypothetical protein [Halosimplex pelagicum]QLH83692.1 hypothetical protein HZS54_19555 [Halosimplex pelagicum]